MRTDASHILTSLRNDIWCRCRATDSAPSPPAVPMAPSQSTTSNTSSCGSLPIRTFSGTLLEQRLAAEIFAEKFGERSVTVSKAQSRGCECFSAEPSASSNGQPHFRALHSLIPCGPVNMSNLPDQATVEHCEAARSSKTKLHKCHHVAVVKSFNPSTDCSHTLQMNSLDSSASALERTFSVDSPENSSSGSLPTSTFIGSASSGQRLSKIRERSLIVSRVRPRTKEDMGGCEGSPTSQDDQPHSRALESLLPCGRGGVGHVPGQVPLEACEAALTSRTLRDQCHHLVAVEASPNIDYSSSSQIDSLNRSPPSLEPRFPEYSLDALDAGPDISRVCSLCSVRSNRWQVEAAKFYDQSSVSACEARGHIASTMSTVFRSLGIIPWSVNRLWLSRIYQLTCLCCLTITTLSVIANSRFWSPPEERHFVSHIDHILVLCTLLSFLSALLKNQALQDASWLIDSYLSRGGRLEEARSKSRLDVAMMVFIWVLCAAARFYAHALALNWGDFAFALNILVFLVMCCYVSRPCRFLFDMVDHFSNYTHDSSDFETTLQEFFLLHCTVRTACASLQLCFVVLLLTATVVFLFASASIYLGCRSVEWVIGTLIPGVLCEVVLLYLLIRAGRVSDLCARVPMLVNSVNAELEIKRMYVVDYIVHSESGFYIFEVRLSTSALLKLFYVAFVGWCGLLTQGMLLEL